WTLPLEDTIRGEITQGLVGPIFLLLPLALFALRYREGRRLLLAGVLVFSTYFANIGTRFLIPSLPFFSLSLALAAGETPLVLAAVMIFQAAAGWPPVLKRYSNRYAWRLERIPFKEALRIIPQEQYLMDRDGAYQVARMIENSV